MIFDESYINSRVKRSKETLDEAKLMFENIHYLTVINRLYYAVFYLASAYLGKAGISTKTHSGTKAKFHELFVKTKIVDHEFAKMYDRLFSDRNETDYGDFNVLEKDEVEQSLFETETLLNRYWIKFYS